MKAVGLCSIERQHEGPTRQAPGLELEHVQRLREVLSGEGNLIGKLGAVVFSFAFMDDIDHVEVASGPMWEHHTVHH